MIVLENLCIENRGFIVGDIDLKVIKGSFHALIGPTGCGKTTLLEAILGLRKIKRGKILLENKDITHEPVHKRGFSYLPQDLAIFPHLTVRENIFFGIRYSNSNHKDDRYKMAIRLAETLGITHILDRKALGLSGGERQRVALTRALATGSNYLLMDEPLSALHEGMKRQLWLLLKDLQVDYNLTILMVSHDLEETFFLSDYITVMIDGKIAQTDRKEIIYKKPKNEIIANFLGIRNIFTGEIVNTNCDYVKIYSSDINQEFFIPKVETINKNKNNGKIKFGIRPNDIDVSINSQLSNGINKVEGKIIKMYDKGASTLVLFKPHNSYIHIDIDLPTSVLKEKEIREYENTTIILHPERIFVLNAS